MQAVVVNSSNDFLLQFSSEKTTSNTNAEEPKNSFSELISKAKSETEKDSSSSKVEQKNENKVELSQEKIEENEISKNLKDSKELASEKNTDLKLSKKELSKKTVVNEKKADFSLKQKIQKEDFSEPLPIHSAMILEQSEQIKENSKELKSTENKINFENLQKKVSKDEELSFSELNINQNLTEQEVSKSLVGKKTIAESQNEKNQFSKSEKLKVSKAEKQNKITVSDYRTIKETNGLSEKKSAKNEKLLQTVEIKDSQVVMELNSHAQQNILSLDSQSASAMGSDFQSMLSNQIQQNAGDIVKAGQIILKDNNEGSIKLILHPESLGNVKIDLQISDKNITGRIVVASQEAFNAFRDSTDSLKQAFINSGFESAGLELAFAGQNAESEQFSQKREDPSVYFAANRDYGIFSDSATENYEGNFIEVSTRNSVNIVA